MSDINKMSFNQLREEVQLLRDELAIFKRKYEDIIYNLDNDNFSGSLIKEKEGMKTSIEQTEKSITLHTEQIKKNEQNVANLKVTADKISTEVASVFNEITKVNSKSAMTDTSKIYTYNDVNWHYNRITNQWEKIDGNSIASSFVQTIDGFELSGDVKISGDLISGGTISGVTVKTSGDEAIGACVEMNSEDNSLNFYYMGSKPRLQITANAETEAIIRPKNYTNLFIGASAKDITETGYGVYATGLWDFYGAEVKNIHPKFA